jgi:molybdate transport system substrate-binding protein
MRRALFALAVALAPVSATAETVNLYAAGSLKAVMADIARAFEAKSCGAVKVETVLGPSGLLRERIEKGEAAHVFASADTGHPKRLSDQGRTAGPPVVFARNELCALARGGLAVTTDTLLERMLDPAIKLGTSTPKADPSGDYAFALFGKAEALKTGAKAALEAKALTLTGGPASETAPAGRNLYAWVMDASKADIFLTYCTNALLAKAEIPSLSIVTISKSLNVGADYGLVILQGAPTAAHDLAAFIRSENGKAALSKHGFSAGD